MTSFFRTVRVRAQGVAYPYGAEPEHAVLDLHNAFLNAHDNDLGIHKK